MAIKFHADVAPWWAQRQPPPPISGRNQEEDKCSEGDSEAEEHSYLPHEVLLVTNNSSEEDSETDDQSYSPPRFML